MFLFLTSQSLRVLYIGPDKESENTDLHAVARNAPGKTFLCEASEKAYKFTKLGSIIMLIARKLTYTCIFCN